MKIVVIGGTGLIGSKLVAKLTEDRHEAVAASPETGANTLTGVGLADVLEGASVVVDVSNAPYVEDAAFPECFTTLTRNLLVAEELAGVRHHVVLSVVGTNRHPESGYLRAKNAQEELIRASRIPYSIVHATQFFEFAKGIVQAAGTSPRAAAAELGPSPEEGGATNGDTIRVAPVLVQPIAADDVVRALGRIAVGSPVEGVVEVAGPEPLRLEVFIRRWLNAWSDPREVVADQTVGYFNALLDERDLLPGFNAAIGETRYADWLSRSVAAKDHIGRRVAGPEAISRQTPAGKALR